MAWLPGTRASIWLCPWGTPVPGRQRAGSSFAPACLLRAALFRVALRRVALFQVALLQVASFQVALATRPGTTFTCFPQEKAERSLSSRKYPGAGSLCYEELVMKGWFGYEGMLFACVYAPEFPAQALLRQTAALQNHPVAVLEGAPPQEKVCAANARARRDGVLAGMTRVEAESFAGIVLLSRSAAMEAEAREALLGCIGTFTPQAETCHTDTEAVCVLDVSGMARLHPDPRTFAVNLQATLRSRRLFASVALSANFYTACALARGVQGVTVAAPGDEQKMLSPLLLEVLAVSEEQLRTLALWGIRTLGGLAALPQKQLIARMGQQGKRLRELARGEHAHLFAPADVPLELRDEYAFEEPVRLLEEILYVLSPMLDHLLLQVRERALAIATLTVTFALEVHAFVSVESGEN